MEHYGNVIKDTERYTLDFELVDLSFEMDKFDFLKKITNLFTINQFNAAKPA